MANRLTEDDKIRINELYLKYKTYSEVSRQTGFSPSTVKKYVIKDYKPSSELPKKEFRLEDIPEDINYNMFIEADNLGKLCILSNEEKEEMKELWKELSL